MFDIAPVTDYIVNTLLGVLPVYLLWLAIVYAGLMIWINTEFPIIIVNILFKLGWRKDDLEFRDSLQLWYSSSTDLYDVLSVDPKTPTWIAELISCPYCLSVHIGFWSGIGHVVLFGGGIGVFALYLLTYPGLLSFMFHK